MTRILPLLPLLLVGPLLHAQFAAGGLVVDTRHPSFAGGAVCDNSTDIGPALQAAWNAVPNSGGEIQIVGNPSPCYWANPTTFHWGSHAGPVTIFLQGELRIGTTLTVPRGVMLNIIGRGGTGTAQFQGPGESAWIFERPTSGPALGTLGTAVTAVGVPTTFTPSTMNGIYPGTAVTVAGKLTCSIRSISRTSNVVTATFAGTCHIPAGVPVTVAGVTDASYNGTYSGGSAPQRFLATRSDYVANTLSWNQSGPNSSSGGGAVTGLNEDTVENVQISATTPKTATATFYRTHNSTDQWGVVALNIDNDTVSSLLQDVLISSDGTGLWLQQTYLTRLEKVGVTATGACSGNLVNWPAEIGYSSFIKMDGVGFNVKCLPWGLRLTQPSNQPYTTSGPVYIDNSFIMSGIKLDHGGAGVFVRNSVFEQAVRGAVQVDPTNYWNGNSQQIQIQNSLMQDDPNEFLACWVNFLQPAASKNIAGSTELAHISGYAQCQVNDYFQGSLRTSSPLQSGINTPRGIVGVHEDGTTVEAELRGEQAGMGPALIPYSTSNVTTNPASWSGGCAVKPGVLAPDGTPTAGSLTSAGSNTLNVGFQSVNPAVGDMILFGGWVYTPTRGEAAQSGPGGDAFLLDNASSAHFQISGDYRAGSLSQATTNVWDSAIKDDWWHPVVGFSMVTSADGSSGTVRLSLNCDRTKIMNYWMPWMMYIPASAGIPVAEVMRWRQQLMHGAVPSNMPSGGGILAINPNHKLYWGNRTNLYASPNGSVGTDQQFDSVHGYKVNGKWLASTHLADWSAVVPANGQVPIWNSSTGKWTPGNPSNECNVSGPLSTRDSNVASLSDSPIQVNGLSAPSASPVVAVIDKTGLTGNVSNTTAYLVPGSGAGSYLISCYEVLTRAAGSSSTLPQCAAFWTDEDTGVEARTAGNATNFNIGQTNVNNSVGTTNIDTNNFVVAHVAGSGIIGYNASGYTSLGANPMTYSLHIKVQYLGP